MPEQAYFSMKQLQKRYGDTSARTIFDWRKDRGFPPAVGPGNRLYPVQDVLDWEKSEGMMPCVDNA